MKFHFNVFSFSLLIAGVSSLLVAVLILYRSTPVVRWCSALMTCVATWAIAYSFELSSQTLDDMLAWIAVEYIGISLIPAAWIFFVISYIDKGDYLSLPFVLLMLLIPGATMVLVWTNELHSLYYEAVKVDYTGPFPLLSFDSGPWYYIHTFYFYLMLAIGVSALLLTSKKSTRAFRNQTCAILIGVCMPWVVNVVYRLGVRPFHHIDLTPFAFILTCFSIVFGLIRYRLFSIIPIAREKILEAIPEGIVVLDRRGLVLDMNSAMRSFLSSNSTDIKAESLEDLLPEQRKLHDYVKDSASPHLLIEIAHKIYEVAKTPVDNKRVKGGIILIFRDVTEQRRATQKIEDQAKELKKINEVKDKLFSIVAHDLRSPIATLSSLLSLVDNNQVAEDQLKSYLSILSANVNYTSAMLENLLYWSMSQMQGYIARPKEFNLSQVIEEKIRLVEKRSADKGIAVRNNVGDSVSLYADTDMIRLVLRNLLANAIKFCRTGDTITMSDCIHNGQVTVTVKDTGIGIDKNHLERLFNRDSVTTPGTAKEKGTGLGLKLCKEFIEMNGGTFIVESTVGKGTTVSFSLPAGARNAIEASASATGRADM